jgi:ATP-dependent Lhr-like helicase
MSARLAAPKSVGAAARSAGGSDAARPATRKGARSAARSADEVQGARPAAPKAASTAVTATAVRAWMASRGHKPFAFQRTVWRAMAEGRSGLLHANAGTGKTLAVWLGALMALAPSMPAAGLASSARAVRRTGPPLTVLWITPMRALAADTLRALDEALQALAPHWTSGLRSGDTASGERAAQDRRLPTVLVTTPESLSLLLARADAPEVLRSVRLAVVDEWHELMGNKRGVQVQLALARLRSFVAADGASPLPPCAQEPMPASAAASGPASARASISASASASASIPGSAPARSARSGRTAHRARAPARLMAWALSATLGNLQEGLDVLVGPQAPGVPEGPQADAAPLIVHGEVAKQLVVDTLLPARAERFAWAGHMGLRMLPQVVEVLQSAASALVFTNTRSQAERWFQALLDARPDWAGEMALHHGSLDHSVREWVERGLKEGRLRAVVCTSSLDLGVDFLPVERVLQIGSAKGVARLVQRAGRSGHAPGRTARITLVPTHSLELVEAAAVRAALQAGQMEQRHSPHAPLDVLVQHLVTVALGGGFTADALLAEVRGTWAYRDLSEVHWQWCLDFVRQGGASLAAYPDYRRAVPDAQGVWRVPDARLARRHRANIGTIVSDASVVVQYQSSGAAPGARLGSVEESFIARLQPGDCFLFAGRLLELVRVHQMTAHVRRATAGSAALPRWGGGRMPLSDTLAQALLRALAEADAGRFDSPELQAVRPLLEIQQRWSALPTPGVLLAETLKSREGYHLFLYPFAGRLVHLGLAGLLAWRAAQAEARTFSIAVNDYGLELLSAKPMDWAAWLPGGLQPARGVQGEEGMGADAGDRAASVACPASDAGAAAPHAALLSEVLASLNATELARRRFREIARIAGLIFQSHPGEQRSNRQLQASASLFFEVFRQYDPGNRLLQQAEEELLRQELDVARLAQVLDHARAQRLHCVALPRPSPLAFPLMVERFREKLSNEPLADRIARMVGELESAAGGEAVGTAHADAADSFGKGADRADATSALAFDAWPSGPKDADAAASPSKHERRRPPRRRARPGF